MPDAIWVVVLSTVVPALIVLVGRFMEKRRGVPATLDAAIDSHVQFVIATLETEIEQRKLDAKNCQSALRKSNKRITELELQVHRLMDQIAGGL